MATTRNLIRKAMDEQKIANIVHQRHAEPGDPEYQKGVAPSKQPKLSKITKNCKIVTWGDHVKTNSEVIRVYVQDDGSRSQANSHKSTDKQWILMKISNIKGISLSSNRKWYVKQLPTNWRGRADKHINVKKSVADNDPDVTESTLQVNKKRLEARTKSGRAKQKGERRAKTNAVMEKLLKKFRAENLSRKQ